MGKNRGPRRGNLDLHATYNGEYAAQLIAMHMTGKIADRDRFLRENRPFNPGDFRDMAHCVKLLDANPPWRERISEMGVYSPRWRALAENWEALEASWRKGDKEATTELINDTLNEMASRVAQRGQGSHH